MANCSRPVVITSYASDYPLPEHGWSSRPVHAAMLPQRALKVRDRQIASLLFEVGSHDRTLLPRNETDSVGVVPGEGLRPAQTAASSAPQWKHEVVSALDADAHIEQVASTCHHVGTGKGQGRQQWQQIGPTHPTASSSCREVFCWRQPSSNDCESSQDRRFLKGN